MLELNLIHDNKVVLDKFTRDMNSLIFNFTSSRLKITYLDPSCPPSSGNQRYNGAYMYPSIHPSNHPTIHPRMHTYMTHPYMMMVVCNVAWNCEAPEGHMNKQGPGILSIDKYHATPDSKVYGSNMAPTRVLSAPDGSHVGPMNLAIRGVLGWCFIRPDF